MINNIRISASKPRDSKVPNRKMKDLWFSPMSVSVMELASKFAAGCSVTGVYTGENPKDGSVHRYGCITPGRRSSLTWLMSNIICIDCDGGNDTGLTLEQIVSRLRLRPHIAYRTMSCPADRDLKFRLVYVTEPVEDWNDFARAWTVIDRMFHEDTGITAPNGRMADGRVCHSDWNMRSAACVVHGAKPGAPMVLSPDLPPYAVGSDDGLIARFYESFGEDELSVYDKDYFSAAKSRALKRLEKKKKTCPFAGGTTKGGQRPTSGAAGGPYKAQMDRFFDYVDNLLSEYLNIEKSNPQKWPEMIIRKFNSKVFIKKSDIPDECEDPEERNIRYAPEDMICWKIGFPRQRTFKEHRVYVIKDHMRRCVICRPSADLLDLVVNGVYFMHKSVDWNPASGRVIGLSEIIEAADEVLDEDPDDWNTDILFKGSKQSRFSINIRRELEDRGIALSYEEYAGLSGDEKAVRSAMVKFMKDKIQGELNGKGRREINYRRLDKVYNPLHPVGWNMRNIEERWPEIPHSRNLLKRYCEARGIDPQTSKGGRPRKK